MMTRLAGSVIRLVFSRCEADSAEYIPGMDLGIVLMLGSAGLTPPELGRAVEERGFDSLFWAEHTHIPVDSTRADGRPVRPYADTFDPFVALSAAAAVTTEIKLGTGVCLVTERDPIVLAKEVASRPAGGVRRCGRRSLPAPVGAPGRVTDPGHAGRLGQAHPGLIRLGRRVTT